MPVSATNPPRYDVFYDGPMEAPGHKTLPNMAGRYDLPYPDSNYQIIWQPTPGQPFDPDSGVYGPGDDWNKFSLAYQDSNGRVHCGSFSSWWVEINPGGRALYHYSDDRGRTWTSGMELCARQQDVQDPPSKTGTSIIPVPLKFVEHDDKVYCLVGLNAVIFGTDPPAPFNQEPIGVLAVDVTSGTPGPPALIHPKTHTPEPGYTQYVFNEELASKLWFQVQGEWDLKWQRATDSIWPLRYTRGNGRVEICGEFKGFQLPDGKGFVRYARRSNNASGTKYPFYVTESLIPDVTGLVEMNGETSDGFDIWTTGGKPSAGLTGTQFIHAAGTWYLYNLVGGAQTGGYWTSIATDTTPDRADDWTPQNGATGTPWFATPDSWMWVSFSQDGAVWTEWERTRMPNGASMPTTLPYDAGYVVQGFAQNSGRVYPLMHFSDDGLTFKTENTWRTAIGCEPWAAEYPSSSKSGRYQDPCLIYMDNGELLLVSSERANEQIRCHFFTPPAIT